MSLARLRQFTVNLAISTIGGHRLWRYTRRLPAGSRAVRVTLRRAYTGRGKTVLVTAQFTLGARRVTLRRTIQFR